MRLIDADELKTILSEEITRRFVRWDKTITVAEWETFTQDIIDNAPTVFDCRSCKNNGNERECVDCHDYSNYVHYEERPQGECIKHISDLYPCDNTQECNVCHAEQAICGNDDNFCPNCGASMKKGSSENER